MDDLIYALADALDVDRHLAADLLAQLEVESLAAEFEARFISKGVN